MAKKDIIDNSEDRSDADKLRYYAGRVDNPDCTPKERSWAKMRVKQITAKISGTSTKKEEPKRSSATTQARCCAESAGIGYGAAKAGKRVPIKDENKDAFRAGVRRGRALK